MRNTASRSRLMKKHIAWVFFLFISSIAAYGLVSEFEWGMAGSYSDSMIGKTTTSGQKYDPQALTAAHKTLPYGTVLEVVNVENDANKKIQVIINDRGPDQGSYILYLTRKAMRDLGSTGSGSIYIKYIVLKMGTGVITNAVTPGSTQKEPVKSVSSTNTTPTEVKTVQADSTNSIAYTEKTVEREMVDKVIDLNLDSTDLDKEYQIDESLEEENDRFIDKGVDPADIQAEEKGQAEMSNTVQLNTNNNMSIATNTTVPEVTPEVELTSSETNANDLNMEDTETEMVMEDDLDPEETEITEMTKVEPEINTWKKYEPKGNPDILLTNLNVIKVEKQEIDKELVEEIQSPPDVEAPKLNPAVTNKAPQGNTKEPVQKEETNKVKVVIDEGEKVPVNEHPQPAFKMDAQGYSYVVQAGAFRKKDNALKLYEQLRKKGFPVFITEAVVKGQKYTRVRIGYYGSLTQAQTVQRQVKSYKIPAIVVRLKIQEK